MKRLLLVIICLVLITSLVPSADLHAATTSLGTWAWYNNLNEKRPHSSSVTLNGFVYILGGGLNSQGTPHMNTVTRAQISGSGDLSSWTNESNLMKETRALQSSATWNNNIYTAGGQTGDAGYSSTVEFATQNPSTGALSQWQYTASMSRARSGLSLVAHDGYLYALGGTNGSTTSNTVESAHIGSGGQLDPWVPLTASNQIIPSELMGSATVANDSYIYISVAGGSNGSYFTKFYRAPFVSGGSIGSWEQTGDTIPEYIASADGVIANGRYYIIGGSSPGYVYRNAAFKYFH
jgi:N-acetylneuraminic acid mutarotase